MPRIDSKKKGNTFEREMARRISLWISNDQRDDLIWRSINSGALFTSRAKKKQTGYAEQIGDLAPIDPLAKWFLYHFPIELKSYKNLQVEGLIWGSKSILLDFWQIHWAQCNQFGRNPILIAKQNRKDPIILLPDNLVCELPVADSACYVNKHAMVIYKLDEFLSLVPFTIFRSKMEVLGFSDATVEMT